MICMKMVNLSYAFFSIEIKDICIAMNNLWKINVLIMKTRGIQKCVLNLEEQKFMNASWTKYK